MLQIASQSDLIARLISLIRLAGFGALILSPEKEEGD